MKEKNHSWQLWTVIYPFLPAVLGLLILWRYIFWGELTIAIISSAAVIVAAIIPGVASLLRQGRQLKHDGKAVKSINADTGAMKPKVEHIDNTVDGIAENVIRIEDRTKQISSIATAVESFKYLKENTSGNAIRPEVLLAQMSNVFEERAKLEVQHKIDQEKIIELTAQNKALKKQNQSLRSEIQIMERKLQKDQPELTL